MTMTPPKIVIIYDQSAKADSDKHVLRGLRDAFPPAKLYRSPITRSSIAKALHRLLPKRQINWFKTLDLSLFDIIISYGTHAKQVPKATTGQLHIHYSHRPAVEPALQKIDAQAAQAVDVFIATSTEAQKSIKTQYARPATIINPPIDISLLTPARQRDNYYVVIDRQTPNDNLKLVTASASQLGIRLRILTLSDSQATFRAALNSAKGFISLAATDFDARQVEALAAGAFVVAYDPHGNTDIIQDSETGILFHELTQEAITTALQKAEATTSLPGTLRRKAKRFDKGLFITKLRKVVTDNHTS